MNKKYKQIFIINGSGGSGKDTFVSLVRECMEEELNQNNLVDNFSSVDKVKEIAKIIGWDGKKTEKDRKFLSDLKLLCTEYNNMPFKSMQEKVEEFKNDDAEFLFLHIREPEEIEKAKKAFNAETILIIRDNIEQITSNMADKNVRDYNYDIVIYNNDTLEELRSKAMKFCIEHDCMWIK